MRFLLTLALVALSTLVPALNAGAQTKPALPTNDLGGEWQGQWTSPSGYLFTTVLTLKVAPDGAADGRFVWTLRHSPLPEEQRKLGLSATEFVTGTVNEVAGTVTLVGGHKVDPDDVIFTDRYRLVVGATGRTLAGVSGNLGDWDGLLFLQR